MAFEVVFTVSKCWDGPREGIANLGGQAYLFQSEWSEAEDDYADTYLLTPIDEETLALALEDWEIWRRWETAFHTRKTTIETHPALPADRGRHEELKALLDNRLMIRSNESIRKLAQFRGRDDQTWSGYGLKPLEVQWADTA